MVEIKTKDAPMEGVKIILEDSGKEIGRTYLFIMQNELHDRPFGLMEDVFVDKDYRGQKLSNQLVEKLVDVAKEKNCYKIICTSRFGRDRLHTHYEKLGFEKVGNSFRMNL